MVIGSHYGDTDTRYRMCGGTIVVSGVLHLDFSNSAILLGISRGTHTGTVDRVLKSLLVSTKSDFFFTVLIKSVENFVYNDVVEAAFC